MPQYNVPALITALDPADIILVWQTAAGDVKTITFQDFVDSVETEFDQKQTANEVTGTTTLDDTYELVVANSAAPFTIYVPLAVNYIGKTFSIVNVGAGTVTVQRLGSGTDLIADGTTAGVSTTVAQYKGYDFKAVATGMWQKMGI